jgi:alpha-tubulin suppressor-like RCC1 family protein
MDRVLRIAAMLAVLAGCDRFLLLQEVPQRDGPPPPDAGPPPSSWTSATAGTYHTCAIRDDQTLWCWGRNDHGQLAVPPDVLLESDQPVQVGNDTWLVVSAGHSHSCGVRTDHTLACWGDNTDAALGTGGYEMINGFSPIAGTSWVTVASGATFACGIDMAGAMQCWGNNPQGELGNMSNLGPSTPVAVAGGPWVSVTGGGEHACAIDTAGKAFCWGNNGYGEIGVGTSSGTFPVTQVVGSDTFTSIAAGDEFTCAVTTTGRIRCWGENDNGELGDGTRTSNPTPHAITGDTGGWVGIAAGLHHACARDQQGSVSCWGENRFGQVASDTPGFDFTTVPTKVTTGPGAFSAIATGDHHTCAIASSDKVMWCAGLAGGGQLASIGSHTSPTQITGTWTAVAAGVKTTCAIDSTQHMSCWGSNGGGPVGDGTTTPRAMPTAVSGNQSWSGVAVGDHVCGLDSTNILYCWGPNGAMQLGDGTTNDRHTPTMTTLTTAQLAHVSSENDSTCVISVNAAICWGENYFGQCGSTVNPQSPGAVSGTVLQVAAGDDVTCALPTGGGVSCWGYGDALADGMLITRSTPGAVPDLNGITFDQLVVGNTHVCARSGTRLWCWGVDYSGQVGDQSNGIARVPFEHTGRAWIAVGAGGDHTCAIESPGRLYCWGGNAFGQVGDGTMVDRSQPTVVGSDTDWASVILGHDHSCAFKTDGSLWCWGGNLDGQIGDNTAWRSELRVVQ